MQVRPHEWPGPQGVSLKGLYAIAATATTMGIIVVFILNVATPMDFILNQLADLPRDDTFSYLMEISRRLFAFVIMILAVCGLVFIFLHRLLRPIDECITGVRAGEEPKANLIERARRRLINLPFLFIAFNLGLWIVIPALVFLSAHLIGMMDLHSAVVLSIRASMVGLISTTIGFFRIESYCRQKLVPFFSPMAAWPGLRERP